MEYIGKAVSQRELVYLNRIFTHMKRSNKRYVNWNNKLYLQVHYRREDMWDDDWGWNVHK